ncbi:unnamed protein product, partial [Schistosoma guineensis]
KMFCEKKNQIIPYQFVSVVEGYNGHKWTLVDTFVNLDFRSCSIICCSVANLITLF